MTASREDWLTPYRLRTVRIGVWTTFLVLAVLVAFALLPGRHRIEVIPFLATVAVAGAGAAVVAMLPWRTLLDRGWGIRVMYVWSVGDILLISLLVLFAGDAGGQLFFLYAFTTVFAAGSYPRRGQIALLAFTFASYVAVEVALGTASPRALFVRLALLAVLWFMADFLSGELRTQMLGHYGAQRESERRATLLATVAEAGRRMNDLDGTAILEDVVDAALALGFTAGNLAMFDDELSSYVVVHGRGLPEPYANAVHPADVGMPSLVKESRRTVVVNDYVNNPRAVPILRDRGYRAVIASPIWVRGNLTAALVAGTTHARQITSQDVEAFELLASFAGRAMENAARFAEERRAVARLADLDRMKGEFVATVSHELRTPLTAILGMGLTLERQWDAMDDPLRREFLQRLNANANALEDIVRTLLDFSTIDAERIEMHREPVEVDVAVRAIVDRLGPLLGRHHVELDLAPAEADADRVLLERIVENLVSNAAKHTPDGTAIRISARGEGSSVVVEIADSGPGIPARDLAHLGDRFFRGGDANTRRTRGTGLGLALVKEILELHGSRLEVRSDVGRGSAFSFRLPRWIERGHADAAAAGRARRSA